MSPLFDDEDWPLSGGPDAPLPSFLRRDPVDLPGPSDIGLTFQSRGPTFQGIATTTWSSPSGYGSSREPAVELASHTEWDPLFDPWPPATQPASQPASRQSAPARGLPAQPGLDELGSEHPSGPLPRTPAPAEFSAEFSAEDVSAYDVTLAGALGYADLGFREGQWFVVGGSAPRPVSTRDAIRAHPELGGPIVQVGCWWMRENPHDPRALDVATELAFAVTELAREASRGVR
jgi:hypothetical protein